LAEWTLDEARAYLPRLRGLLFVIRRSARVASMARANGHGRHTSGTPAERPEPPATADVGALGGAGEEPAADELPDLSPADALSELDARGVVLRDIERGLVDFPCRHPTGKTVLLCWQLDEPDVAWWHLPEEGFAGRRPLPLPPDL
jgi:hypothetical protein